MVGTEINRAQLAYEEKGQGVPVLFLHGMAGTGASHFSPLLEALSPDYRVIAPDLRGHGKSGDLPLTCDCLFFQRHTDDLETLINDLDLPPLHLVGYSDGGEIAILLAARLGARARSLTIWGVSGRVPPPAIVALYADGEHSIPGWPAFCAELEALHGPGSAPKLLGCWANAMSELAAQGGVINDEAAARLLCPTLIVTGDADPFNPLLTVQALAARIPTAKIMVLPGAGHDLLQERGPQLEALLRRRLTAP
ncbi:MAG: alpha/beta hydrolase [Ardenticatenales bacterium]|nr:alpha/beta hydrolase [Ardenticatenales bacterium]